MESLAEKGRDFYNRKLKSLFEPERNGEREVLAKAETAFPDRQFYLQRKRKLFAL